MWPHEAPRLHRASEELLAAAYEPTTSRRMRYVGIAAFAVICLAVFGIYQWHGASTKPAEQPTQELHDQSLPGAGASTRPATGAAKSLPGSAPQRSNAAPQSTSAPGADASASTADLGEQEFVVTQGLRSWAEQQAKIKEFVSQGRALSDRGEYTAAIDMFDSALKLDPHSSEAKAGKRQARERMQLEQALPNEPK
jgi:tetratricopeptide (TPR) repeat protein